MAFIDGDEFIFPQENKSIIEVVDEILRNNPRAGGLAVNIYYFGSNNFERADYSKGVMERFTRRAPVDWLPVLNTSGAIGGTAHVKTITNPRRVNFFFNPHFAVYFSNYHAVNEEGKIVPSFSNNPPTVNKIVMNHYCIKSLEEYFKKKSRGTADAYHNIYNDKYLNDFDHNEVFDDSILKYLDNRRRGGVFLRRIDYQRLYSALLQNLSSTFSKKPAKESFEGKMETFLICLKLAEHMRKTVLDEDVGKFFEDAALKAIYRTFFTNLPLADINLLLGEMPNILTKNYPVVNDIRQNCIKIIPQILNSLRIYDANAWKEFVNLKSLMIMLKTFDNYEHKN